MNSLLALSIEPAVSATWRGGPTAPFQTIQRKELKVIQSFDKPAKNRPKKPKTKQKTSKIDTFKRCPINHFVFCTADWHHTLLI